MWLKGFDEVLFFRKINIKVESNSVNKVNIAINCLKNQTTNLSKDTDHFIKFPVIINVAQWNLG